MAATDLSDVEPEVLDRELKRLFAEHGQAIDAGDTEAATELHWCIQAIQDEYARRTLVWIAGRAQA